LEDHAKNRNNQRTSGRCSIAKYTRNYDGDDIDDDYIHANHNYTLRVKNTVQDLFWQ